MCSEHGQRLSCVGKARSGSWILIRSLSVVLLVARGFPAQLVQNGDFAAGSSGFTSSATYVPGGGLSAGQYTVRSDPGTANSLWVGGDHTSGATNFLMCDGPSGIETVAWRHPVRLIAGHAYTFSAWMRNLLISPTLTSPVMELRVNGVTVAGPMLLPASPNGWISMSATFAATTTTVVLEIVSKPTTGNGNDFGIDDISLKPRNELVANWNFELGNASFSSAAAYKPTGHLSFGEYSVRPNPTSANPQWGGVDHTTGTGDFLMCDGITGSPTAAWRQTVQVCPGLNYEFSAWANNLVQNNNFSDPRIELRVNGITVAAPVLIPEIPDRWVKLSGSFTATGSFAVLEIWSVSAAALGNDFGIDDVSLTTQDYVTNGTFASGNTGFTSTASHVPSGAVFTGQYSVRTQPTGANSQWAGQDHTTGIGNYLMCNGRSGSPTAAWQQTVAACPGRTYVFSAWVNNLGTINLADPRIELRVDGTTIAGPLVIPETPDQWVRVSGTFVATGSTAMLEIWSVSTAGLGNDFGIDDVTLTDSPGIVIPYGCGVNPSGSLLQLSPGPTIGATWIVGVENPLGTQPAGSLAYLAIDLAPDTAFPCGSLLPNMGMASPGAPGELLLSMGSSTSLYGPVVWGGTDAPAVFPLAIPNNTVFLGAVFYVQGLIVTRSFTGSILHSALTEAFQVHIGPF